MKKFIVPIVAILELCLLFLLQQTVQQRLRYSEQDTLHFLWLSMRLFRP